MVLDVGATAYSSWNGTIYGIIPHNFLDAQLEHSIQRMQGEVVLPPHMHCFLKIPQVACCLFQLLIISCSPFNASTTSWKQEVAAPCPTEHLPSKHCCTHIPPGCKGWWCYSHLLNVKGGDSTTLHTTPLINVQSPQCCHALRGGGSTTLHSSQCTMFTMMPWYTQPILSTHHTCKQVANTYNQHHTAPPVDWHA